MKDTQLSYKNSRLYNGLMEAVAFLDAIETQKEVSRLPELFEYIDSDNTDPAIHSTTKDLAEKLVRGQETHILYGLEHGGPITQQICVLSAGEMGLESAVEPLLVMLENRSDSIMIQNILSAFEKMKDDRVAKAASLFLDDPDALTVVSAIAALKNRKNETYAIKLAGCLNSKETIVAYSAAEVMGTMGGGTAARYLADHIHNEQPSVRRAVAASLVKIGKEAISGICQKLESGNMSEIESCLTVLGEIGVADSVDRIKPFCSHEGANIRYLAYEAIGKIGADHILLLEKGLYDTSYAVVCVVINALDRFNAKACATLVLNAVKKDKKAKEILPCTISDMCANNLFAHMSSNEKVLKKVVACAVKSKNPYLINCFLNAADHIENTKLKNECINALETAMDSLPEIKGKILVADDSPTMRKFYSSILPKHGYAVDAAEDGLGAIKKFEVDSAYDLVLCDINMPNKNGIELARHIRQELFSNVPILVVTTEVMASQKKEAESANANGFLTKPFTVDALLEAIDMARESA